MDEWRDCFDNPPDWGHSGAKIVLKYADGRETEGTLQIDEWWTGEDEVPVPGVVGADGGNLSFYDAEKWRLAPNTPAARIP